jgi:hypothetical protein
MLLKMTRFRIVAVTAASVIALVACWKPPHEDGGTACPGGRACAEAPSPPGGSGSPDWFYGGQGMDRIRGDDGDDRSNLWRAPKGEEESRCSPGRDEAPAGAGEELPRSCADVGVRLY